MATLLAISDNNLINPATWAVCHSSADVDNEAGGAFNAGTTYTDSSSFTPGAVTISGIALKLFLNGSVAQSGTFSVALRTGGAIPTIGGIIPEVTVNVTDINSARFGWYYFKFNGNVTLTAATAYTIAFKASVANTVGVASAASTNISKQIVTTTTQSPNPLGGDKLIIPQQFIANATTTLAGTTVGRVVTVGNAIPDFTVGKGITTDPVNDAISLGGNATLKWGADGLQTNLQGFWGLEEISGNRLDVSTMGNHLQSVGVISRAGGTGVQTLATTNLLTPNQSSAETDTTGWNPFSASTYTWGRTTADSYVGTACVSMTNTSGITDDFYLGCGISVQSGTISQGNVYTGSAYVKLPVGRSVYMTVEFRQADGTWISGNTSTAFTGTGNWQRIYVSTTIAGDLTTMGYVRALGRLQPGDTMYVDALQLEYGLTATPWVLGGTSRGPFSAQFDVPSYNLLSGPASTFDYDSNADGLADEWRWINAGAGNTATLRLVTGVNGTGKAQYYKRLTWSSWGHALTTRVSPSGIHLTAGTQYTLSFWAKSSSAQTWTVYIANDPSTVYYFPASGSQSISTTTTWTKYSYTFNSANTGTDAAIKIQTATDGNDIYLDNIQLEPVGYSTSLITPNRNMLSYGVSTLEVNNAHDQFVSTNSATRSTDDTFSYLGAQSVKVVTGGVGSGEGINNAAAATMLPVTVGQQYTFSAYVYGTGSIIPKIWWYNSSLGFVSSSNGSTVTLGNGWQRISANGAAPATAVWAVIDIDTSSTQTITFWIDALQFEAGSSATTFINGMSRGVDPSANLLTRNLSDVETNYTDFSIVGSTALSKDTSEFWQGTSSLKVITPGSVSSEGAFVQFNVNVPQSPVYTGSVYVKGVGTCDNMRMWTRIVYTDASTTEGPGSATPVTFSSTGWTRYVSTVFADTTKTVGYIQIFTRTNGTFSRTWYADGWQLELKPYATPWMPGGATRDYPTFNLLTANQSNNETDVTTGFNNYGAGSTTRTQDSTTAWQGTYSQKIVTDGATSGATNQGVMTVGKQLSPGMYTFSAYVKGSGTLWVGYREGNTLISHGSSITLTGTWTRYSHTFTISSSTTDSRFVVITDSSQSITYYVDALQLEMLPFATPWIVGGASVDEASSNLLSANQSNFESGGTGWGVPSGSYTIATDKVWHGLQSAKFSNSGAGLNTSITSGMITVTPGATYTYSAYIWNALTAGSSSLDWIEYSNVAGGGQYQTLDGDNAVSSRNSALGWQRMSVTFTPQQPYIMLRWVNDGSAVGDAWIDGIQFEQMPYPTQFMTGGTSRTGLSSVPLLGTGAAGIVPGSGDFSFGSWVYLDAINTNSVHTIVSKGAAVNGYREFTVGYDGINNRFFVQNRNSGGTGYNTQNANTFGAPTAKTWYFIYAYYDSVNSQIGISINNGTVDSLGSATISRSQASPILVGGSYAINNFQGRIDTLGLWKRLLTTTERTQLYNGGNSMDAAGAYTLTVNGNVRICGGSTVSLGTSTYPIPLNSTAELVIGNAGANVDFGVKVENNGSFITQGTWAGAFDTNGNPIVHTRLAADANTGATSLTTADTTGWKSGDTIIVPSTNRGGGQYERFTLGANASGTTITLPSALVNPHTGSTVANTVNGTSWTQDMRGAVLHLNRNVKVRGISGTLSGYVSAISGTTSIITTKYTEFTYLGSGTGGKRGINFESNNTCTMFGCSIYDWTNPTGTMFYLQGSAVHDIRYVNIYNTTSQCLWNSNTTSTIDHVWSCRGNGLYFGGSAGSFTNCIATDCTGGTTINVSNSGIWTGTINNLVSFGSGGAGIQIDSLSGNTGVISNLVAWRNNISNGGIVLSGLSGKGVITDVIGWGGPASSAGVILFNTGSTVSIVGEWIIRRAYLDSKFNGNLFGSADASTGNRGILPNGSIDKVIFEDSIFGGVGTFSTGDFDGINARNYGIQFRNCLFNSSTEFATSANMLTSSALASHKHDQTTNNNRTQKREGLLAYDSVIYDVASPSLKMIPAISTEKLTSPKWQVAVKAGQTPTISVRVRKSAAGDGTAYTGNQPRLIMVRNPAIGVLPNANMFDLQQSTFNNLAFGPGYLVQEYGGAGATPTGTRTVEVGNGPNGENTLHVVRTDSNVQSSEFGVVVNNAGGTAPWSNMVVGRLYTVSCWVKAPLVGPFIIQGTIAAPSNCVANCFSNYAIQTLTNTWQRLSATFLYQGSKSLRFMTSGTVITEFWMASPMIEPGIGPGKFVPGGRTYVNNNSYDLVAATAAAATGTWETLSYTLNATDMTVPTSDGVIEFYVDCDGTAGWINVDNVTVT